MSGIRISTKNAKCPLGNKLSSKIVSYLFEQEYGECRNYSPSEIDTIRKAANILQR